MGNTPATGWHWNITPEQIEKIKANDREMINSFYLANYQKFRRIGFGFCRRAHCFEYLEDFLQEVYLFVPFFNYTDTRSFYSGLVRCFYKARGYNRYLTLSLDMEIYGDEDITLADTIADDSNIDDYILADETVKEISKSYITILAKCICGNKLVSDTELLADIVEYVFAGYTFEQIQQYARG